MKKKILFTFLALLLAITLTGCNKEETKEEKKEETKEVVKTKAIISAKNIEKFETVANLVFKGEKESLKISDLNDEEKTTIALSLPGIVTSETTGTGIINEYKEYFGKNENLELQNVKCFMKHDKEDEQDIYIFDKEKDQYIYNDKHPGHGGGGDVTTSQEIKLDRIEIEENEYHFFAKVLFYGPIMCDDTGPCTFGKAYKSYEDLINKKNSIGNAASSKVTWDNPDGFEKLITDELMNSNYNSLEEYEFIFTKEDNNYVFKEYKKGSTN